MTPARTIIGFGASSMKGTGDSVGGFFKRTTPAMAERWSGVQIVNLGVGGDTTRDMLARADQVRAYEPRDVIVMLGCNDVPRDHDGQPAKRTTLEEYASNLDQLLPAIRGGYSLFISSFPVSAEKTGVAAVTLESYMHAAMRTALRHGYQIWDLHKELSATGESPRFWAADGLHFSDAGHELIASRLLQKLPATLT